MNVIKFNSYKNLPIVFCIVDNTHQISDNYVKEITKNQADFTISNLWTKGYTIYQGLDVNELLREASDNFDFACVISTGTEMLNGDNFFNSLNDELNDNFLIKGHILDRGDAYYELHHQCFLINLKKFKDLNFPLIGQQILGSEHTQFEPKRSIENDHGTYTPLIVEPGNNLKKYNHKCHGWNIISVSLANNIVIKRFSKTTIENKKHFYPESLKDFYTHSRFLFSRERFCSEELVHYINTESMYKIGSTLTQLVTPASGIQYLKYLDKEKPVHVIMYDYNQNSLDYYEKNVPRADNVKYSFIKWNLLTEVVDLKQYLDSKDMYTLINLSNIFCYEGTAIFANLRYRLEQETRLLKYIKENFPLSYIHFSGRSTTGFVEDISYTDRIDKIKIYNIFDIKKPTWRMNSDWC